MNIKPCNITPEQRKIINRNIFQNDCKKFFDKVNQTPLKSNIYRFGKLLESSCKYGLDEYQVNTMHKNIKTLISKNKRPKMVHLVNIMYSSIIKRITPYCITSGSLKPETYRQLIDDSIKMYKDYPLSGGIDYRHILGRLVSLKDMCISLEKKKPAFLDEFSPVNWTINEQLELVNLLDIVSSNYKRVSSDFKIYPYAPNHVDHREILSTEEVRSNYYQSIVKLLWMLRNNAKKILGKAGKTDEVKHTLELAEYYFNKIPFKDALKMPRLWVVVSEFKKIGNIVRGE